MENLPYDPTIVELMKLLTRLFHLRERHKAHVPEQIALLKKKIHEADSTNNEVRGISYDLFFNTGRILSTSEEPIAMGELSNALKIPLSTATRIVDLMVENNFVVRLSDPNDRRIVRIKFSPEGLEMYKEVNAFLVKRVERLLRYFNRDELEMMIQLLRKLTKAMEEDL